MSEYEDTLQERIEQYENGDLLEACLIGLSEQDASALRLIATMNTMVMDDADTESIAAQRAGVLQAATVGLNGAGTSPTPVAASFRVQLQNWLSPLWAQREVKYALAGIVLILFLGLIWRGLNSTQTADESGDMVASLTNGKDEELITAGSESNAPAESIAGAPATPQGSTVFLPVITVPLITSVDTAVINNIQGIVEVQTEAEGAWTAVSNNFSLAVGQRVRTGELSRATLSFYDGSEAHLSAHTEISIDELNALRPEDGFRTVIMTQWIGDSEHSVAFRNDGGSRYEVKTPDGSGIARGTKFHVLVAPNMLSRYIVTEGKVDVSGQNQVVAVIAGQVSTILTGSIPDEPNFNISGEGEVTAMGNEWTIAGQTFQTHEHTIIVGNPQVGDLVHVNGHLLADGSRVADHIVLLRRAVINQFTIRGEVTAMGDTWVVAGQDILVNAQTAVDDEITTGDMVRVEGIILPGGTLQATKITELENAPGLPFQFSGIVQAMNGASWTVSGQMIVVDGDTAVSDNIETGDVVAVTGWILDDGSWLAKTIEAQEDDLPTFEFTGSVQSLEPWRVAGITFATRDWTVVAPGINIGDRVHVHGSILADGIWVAETITSLDDVLPNTITFIGVVNNTNPWMVNGLPLVVTDNTLIQDNLVVGSYVVVKAQLLPDGSWVVLSIRALYPTFGYGCLTLSSPITAIDAEWIELKHWHMHIKRDGRIKIHGDLKVNHVTNLPICTGWDGTPIIIGDIIIIYQPVVIIINNGGGNNIPPGCKITGKGVI